MSHENIRVLKERGISAIMNLCAEFTDLHEIEKEAGFEVYHLPIIDDEAPAMDALEKALEWLDEAIYLKKKVLIHCRYGIGRTGTVLNTYLLRRGLGHKLAARTLKKLRSKPASFDQWWAVRRYGRKSGKLTIRQPSLERDGIVDLAPFFRDYETVLEQTDERVESLGITRRCGRDHADCCRQPVEFTLIGATHLHYTINQRFSHKKRIETVHRAVTASTMQRKALVDMEQVCDHYPDEFCLLDTGSLCPLSVNGKCQVYEWRPFQCRLFDLPSIEAERLWNDELSGLFETISRQIYVALNASLPPEGPMQKYSLPDAVSGRFVQSFFNMLIENTKL